MCRLFALSGGATPVSAQVWLLDAPNSLVAQSHHNPDGTGLGVFDAAGRPVVHKAPIAAYEDVELAREARHERSRTFLGHVRFATTGPHTLANTHPFAQDGRLFGHNGVVEGLTTLEAHLGDDLALVHGDTDSERLFALVTREIRRHDGDIATGLVAAVAWVARELPMYSLNLILTTATDVFALRYPDTNTLFVLERPAGGEPLAQRSRLGTRLHSEQAAQQPVVVVASEPMDDDAGWREMEPGELVHVDDALRVTRRLVLPDAPAHLLALGDLGHAAQASQA